MYDFLIDSSGPRSTCSGKVNSYIGTHKMEATTHVTNLNLSQPVLMENHDQGHLIDTKL